MKKTTPPTQSGKKSTSTANGAAASANCELPPLPVSKKFYAAIRQRVTDSCACLPNGKEVSKSALALIDTYLAMGIADLDWRPIECGLIFALVKPEIDKAMERSRAARERAARKKKAMMEAIATDGDAGEDERDCMPVNQSDMQQTWPEPSVDGDCSTYPETAGLSRRRRRAMQRSPKRKWVKISTGSGKV